MILLLQRRRSGGVGIRKPGPNKWNLDIVTCDVRKDQRARHRIASLQHVGTQRRPTDQLAEQGQAHRRHRASGYALPKALRVSQ